MTKEEPVRLEAPHYLVSDAMCLQVHPAQIVLVSSTFPRGCVSKKLCQKLAHARKHAHANTKTNDLNGVLG